MQKVEVRWLKRFEIWSYTKGHSKMNEESQIRKSLGYLGIPHGSLKLNLCLDIQN